jgi:hypothetical protein
METISFFPALLAFFSLQYRSAGLHFSTPLLRPAFPTKPGCPVVAVLDLKSGLQINFLRFHFNEGRKEGIIYLTPHTHFCFHHILTHSLTHSLTHLLTYSGASMHISVLRSVSLFSSVVHATRHTPLKAAGLTHSHTRSHFTNSAPGKSQIRHA